MPSLREVQTALMQALLGTPGPAVPSLAAPAAGLAYPTAGIEVYGNTVRRNFNAALRCTFPVILRLVGEDYFDRIAASFHRAHPSRSGDLAQAGREFPAFLVALHGDGDFAYLPDVARFEWLCEESLSAAAHRPFDLQALAAVPPSAYDSLRFRLNPSVRLFDSRYPVRRIWEANRDPDREPDLIDLNHGSDRLAISRRDGALWFHELSPGERRFLGALAEGAAFADALEPGRDAAEAATAAATIGASHVEAAPAAATIGASHAEAAPAAATIGALHVEAADTAAPFDAAAALRRFVAADVISDFLR